MVGWVDVRLCLEAPYQDWPGALLSASPPLFKLPNWGRILRYELAEYEWVAIKPMLPNKPRGVELNDERCGPR
jgi:hypothetical protein